VETVSDPTEARGFAAMARWGEMEEEDDDEYAKLVRRMNPPRYTYTYIHDCSCMYSCILLLMPFEFLYCSSVLYLKLKNLVCICMVVTS